ncbi:putative ribonuclearoprotein zinc-finger pf type-C4 [Encephalitozoon hellem]|nr:putative ribonuclearoprotein zinc-finger pf type-C4 [Encephalitozoon hellem]
MSECEYCKSRNMLPLSGKYYCEECEIYYIYKDKKQEYSNLPIEDVNQMCVRDHLCRRCKSKYSEKKTIACTTFREYFRRLPLCEKCKKSNEKSIKNAFFRNFILYKMYGRVFSVLSIILYTTWFYLMGNTILYKVVMVNIIAYKKKGLRLYRCLLDSILVTVLGLWNWSSIPFYMYCLASMIYSKRWYYKVPVNLDSPPQNILEYLEQLNIGKKKCRKT